MKFLYPLPLVLVLVVVSCDDDNVKPVDIDPPAGYSLLWHDEFNGSSIDPDNWDFQTGNGTDYGLPAGWGNNELQDYTANNENAAIDKNGDDSFLRITAREDGSGGFTSARLVTKDLVSIRYGRLDVRAKLPEGQGIWPAIWLLGDNIDEIDWPGCGEIDIAELLGNQPWTYYSTIHFTNSENKHEEIQEVTSLSGERFSDAYHVFSLDWTPEYITFFLDNQQVLQIPIEDDMKEFRRSFYLILNIAVGGYWPGEPDNSTVFPQSMLVDYVRLFYRDGFTPDDPPVLNIEEETVGQITEPDIGDNAIKDGFTALGSLEVIAYGGGGEPFIATSETAIDGELSLSFDYPGGNWGGAYIQLQESKNLSGYSALKFSLNMPGNIADAEIKLESPATNSAIFLKDYTGTDAGQGFYEYTIPLSHFSGLELKELSIAFAIWNPLDADGNFTQGAILIDNIYFVE